MNQDDSDTDLKLTLCIICQREDSRKVGGISYFDFRKQIVSLNWQNV